MTVVIPTRDRWPLVSRALASALAQKDVSVEVVVVDDGSVDETPSELARLSDERLRVVRLSPNRGVACARNCGIAEARGTWIAFLDDDDLWAPHKLRRQLVAVQGSDAALVYTGAVVIDPSGRVKRLTVIPEPSELDAGMLESNLIGTPSGVMVKTDVVREAGGFDERLAVLADWDLWLRLLQQGRAAAVREHLIAYVEHTANMHIGQLGRIRAERRYMARKHRVLCKQRGVRFGGLNFSRWLVGEYRPRGRRLDAAREYARIGLRYRQPRDLARAVGILLGESFMKLGPRQAANKPPRLDYAEPRWLGVALEDRV